MLEGPKTSLTREKVERLYISPPVLATQVARSRHNLGSCGSVSGANSTEKKEEILQSGLDVCIPFENIAYKEAKNLQKALWLGQQK